MTRFDTRLARFPRYYTWLVFVVLGAIMAFQFARGNEKAGFSVLAVTAGFFLVGLTAVRGLTVGDGQLIIHRVGRSTYVDLSNLVEAVEQPKLVGRSFSVWSTRGLFGFIGYGYSSGIGTYRAYVTDASKAVLLRFESGRSVVVSPDRPRDFVATVMNEVSSRS